MRIWASQPEFSMIFGEDKVAESGEFVDGVDVIIWGAGFYENDLFHALLVFKAFVQRIR